MRSGNITVMQFHKDNQMCLCFNIYNYKWNIALAQHLWPLMWLTVEKLIVIILINQNKVGSVCKGERLRAEARSSEEKYIYWSTVGEASGSFRKLP